MPLGFSHFSNLQTVSNFQMEDIRPAMTLKSSPAQRTPIEEQEAAFKVEPTSSVYE